MKIFRSRLLLLLAVINISLPNVSYAESAQKGTLSEAENWIRKSEDMLLIQWDSAVKFARKGVELSSNTSEDSISYKARLQLGISLRKAGYNMEASETFEQLYADIDKLSDEDKSTLLYEKGMSHIRLHEVDSAMISFHKLFSSTSNSRSESEAHYGMGLASYRSGFTTEAMEHFQNALDICQKNADYDGMVVCYNQISTVYRDLYEDSTSYAYLQKAKDLIEQYPIKLELQTSHLSRIARYHLDQGDYDQSIALMRKEMEVYEAFGGMAKLPSTYMALAYAYQLNFSKSESYKDSAIYFADKILKLDFSNTDPFLKKDNYQLLSTINQFLGRKDEALKFMKLSVQWKDTLYAITTGKASLALREKYESERKESEIAIQSLKLKQASLIRNGLIVLLALVVLVVFLIWRSWAKARRSNELLMEKNRIIKEAEQLKSRWFVNVSHELKTPITLVQGPIQKVLEHDALNAIDKSDLKMANRNLKQLKNLTNEILDLSKLENGSLELKNSIVDFSSLIRIEVASFESLADYNKVKLNVQADREITIEGDESKLRKLVQNLLSNALKFTHEGGEIQLSLKEIENHFELEVKDNGEGISPEDLPFVFDRFYQSKNEKKSNQGGTGIGLAISKEIAQMHGGSLEVISQVEKGSSFYFKFPLSLEREGKERTAIQEDLSEQLTKEQYRSRVDKKPRLLLAEDNPDMREYILGIMKQDYQITSARDGKEALEKLQADHFDLIISDVMMPRMDGLELIKEVKRNEKWSQIPFIILTALNNEEHRIHTLRTGVDDYLSKPFNPEELKVRTANLLNNHRGRREEEVESELSFDDQLLKTLEQEVNDHLSDHLLSVTFLADKAAMSERNLRRYLKKTTGLSPSDFILEIKLQKALVLLEKRVHSTVKEVANRCGFDRADRFSTAFVKRYGKSPSEYL
ncbi:ATP-binding protein [Reichenbachiella sp.]